MSPSQSAAKPESAGAVPSPAAVLGQRDRILASDAFAASTLRRALFRFLVDETLAGRADRNSGWRILAQPDAGGRGVG